MQAFVFTLLLIISPSAFAGMNHYRCFNTHGEKIIRLETIEDSIISGWMKPYTLKEAKVLARGVVIATADNSTVVFLGHFQKAVVMNSNNEITADLECEHGR